MDFSRVRGSRRPIRSMEPCPRAAVLPEPKRRILLRFNRWTQHPRSRRVLWGDHRTGCGKSPDERRCGHRALRGCRVQLERLFWGKIAEGLLPAEAGVAVGVSPAKGSRWFRDAGGMSPYSWPRPRGRYLSFAEREEIALLKAQGSGVRAIATALGRSPSTISRELRRNAATRGRKPDYRTSVAQWKAELFARRPKTAKLVDNPRLRNYVQARLAGPLADERGNTVKGPMTHAWTAATSPTAPTAHGCRRGVLSRSRGGCGSTSPMTSRCGSATKPSTRRSTSRVVALCVGN